MYKLSNMCGAFFDHRGNRLLVFNTSGHAFLYDMATGDKLLPKIYLKASDLEGEGMAINDDYLWYLDKKRGRIKRLNLLDGSVEVNDMRVLTEHLMAGALYKDTNANEEICDALKNKGIKAINVVKVAVIKI